MSDLDHGDIFLRYTKTLISLIACKKVNTVSRKYIEKLGLSTTGFDYSAIGLQYDFRIAVRF